MRFLQDQWKQRIHAVLSEAFRSVAQTLDLEQVVCEIPPKPEMGDLAFPMFSYAKVLRVAPGLLARQAAEALQPFAQEAQAFPLGPYVNLRFSRPVLAAAVLDQVEAQGARYGQGRALAGQRVMIEFSSPNTNKPLHLGHLRNNTLGESLSRILAALSAEVLKVNLINDRGIHICKSMLAYQKFANGETPASRGLKSDHFVGEYYVKFAQWAKQQAEAGSTAAEDEAQALLLRWEAGDEAVRELWQRMNRWAVEGIFQTYQRTGIRFDRLYYESQTYQLGKEQILKGLAEGHFYRRDDGAIVVDLPWKNSPDDAAYAQKVLLRADGTSIYLTQDIGTVIARAQDWPFNQLIYVVGNEQDYHFRVLFYVLAQLGYAWAAQLYHLSYGMVNLPDGRMKSREGTVVDADTLLDELRDGALAEIRAKGREAELADASATAEAVALGALHYFLLQASPAKDMVFNSQESLSFNGNTGPYLQYMGTRISSMVLKAGDVTGVGSAARLDSQEEWEILKLLSAYPETVEAAGLARDPSLVATLTYDLAKAYSKFYHDHPVLNAADPELVAARLRLSKAVLQVLQNAFHLLNIPFLQSM